jgi:uncharacterized protein YijF (DUF1287 family)
VKKRNKGKSKVSAHASRPVATVAAGVDRPMSFTLEPAMLVPIRPANRVDAASNQRLPVGLSWNTAQSAASSGRISTAADDRRALALLLLPFLMVATALGISRTQGPTARWLAEHWLAAPIEAPRMSAPIAVTGELKLPTAAPSVGQTLAAAPVSVAAVAPAPIRLPGALSYPQTRPSFMASNAIEPRRVELSALIIPLPVMRLPTHPPFLAPERAPALTPAIAVPPAVCVSTAKPTVASSPVSADQVGLKLAHAALAQTKEVVIYSAAYKRISFPMGDVATLHGSCSDVIIRAYRAVGIDLQDLVQRARIGSGDANIDHRRTDTLRAFFAKHGQVVAPSTYPEFYKPGDIVTYYRPFSRVSRAHIAIVSDVIAPSGRPMIVHNRGWGPQLEDALFVDRITGHYRFTGAPYLMAAAGKLNDGNTLAVKTAVPNTLAKLRAVAQSRSQTKSMAAAQ